MNSAIGALVRPILKEFEAINNDTPATLLLGRDRDDPEARASFTRTIDSLIRRSQTNLELSQRVATSPYRPLQTMARSLVEAQSGQIAALQAARRYLETGDPERLIGSGGVHDAMISAKEAMKAFQEQHLNFARDNNSVR
jgi:hypothetical protein